MSRVAGALDPRVGACSGRHALQPPKTRSIGAFINQPQCLFRLSGSERCGIRYPIDSVLSYWSLSRLRVAISIRLNDGVGSSQGCYDDANACPHPSSCFRDVFHHIYVLYTPRGRLSLCVCIGPRTSPLNTTGHYFLSLLPTSRSSSSSTTARKDSMSLPLRTFVPARLPRVLVLPRFSTLL